MVVTHEMEDAVNQQSAQAFGGTKAERLRLTRSRFERYDDIAEEQRMRRRRVPCSSAISYSGRAGGAALLRRQPSRILLEREDIGRLIFITEVAIQLLDSGVIAEQNG